MRKIICLVAVALSGSACVAASPPPPVVAPVTATIPANAPNCREYTAEATIDGKPQQVVGRACRREDGSWQVVEGTVDQPAQFVAVYPPPPYPYPYYYPWYWGPPFGFGASFVFVNRHHHGGFHHH